jgi:Domain of unknown function (DUF5671)
MSTSEGPQYMQEELRTFIESAKNAGASDSFLATLLEESGWPKKEIWLAFGDHYARVTGMPVPRRATGAESAKDAFLYMLAFISLATWTWALGSMMFTFINQWFPDPVYPNGYRATDYNVTFEMASIFVAFPLYLYVMRLIAGQVEEHPEKLASDVRKWLTYTALLLAAGCLIGDLITLLNYLLRGEVTARFICKVLVVLMIAGGVFGYYLQSLRTYEASRNRIFSAAATVAVVLVIALGFFHLGTPSFQRLLEGDRRRVQDLRAIMSAINNRKSVPPTLRDIGIVSTDPVTKQPYEFRSMGGDRYQVCATFAAKSENDVDTFWNHPAGRHCYEMLATVYH